ncbi:hypothetical protein, partial [Mycobacteroides abscessus]|uniref:hypothetical protein n=1 Tax=Mycobacteroides abscessus TaxID=36809 RepID=UPI003FA0BB71
GLLENKTVLANLMLPLNISKKDMPKIIEINAHDVINIFQYLNRQGVTIIMATHSQNFFDIGTELIDLDVQNA